MVLVNSASAKELPAELAELLTVERQRTEAALRRYAQRLQILQEIDHAILLARSPAEIAHAAMSRIRQLVPCQRASVILFDFEKMQARVMALDGQSGPPRDTLMPIQDLSPREILGQGPVRYVEDIAARASRPPVFDRLLADGLRSFISVPFFADGKLFGELNLVSTEPGAFKPEYQEIAREVAGPLAVAIDQSRLREEATQAEVLRRTADALQTLLNSVSHNLRTPLAIIKAGANSLLQDDVEWDAAQRRAFAASIDREVDRLNRLVGNMLDMSRIEAGVLRPEKEPYPIREVVLAVAARLAKLAEDHALVVDVSDDLPVVPLDYVQIDQVLSNLVENAIVHTRPGTEVRVEAHAGATELRVLVIDRGPGVPAEEHERVFEKFERLGRAPSRSGTGLGLTVSKGLVEAHGGRIWIEDTPGSGTTVVFTLPLADRAGPHAFTPAAGDSQ